MIHGVSIVTLDKKTAYHFLATVRYHFYLNFMCM
jgi:hypothetical protein